MGYNTDFEGRFEVLPPMSEELVAEINKFSETRHGGNMTPHSGYPGFWCDWMASNSTTIEWNGGEKFYDYTEWLKIVINKFVIPNGHTVNGVVRWRGEDFDDVGSIVVKDNKVEERKSSW